MDKYQEYLLNEGNDFSCYFQYVYEGKKRIKETKIKDKIVVVQEEDIHFTKYPLHISGYCLAKVYANVDGKWKLLKKPEEPIFSDVPEFEVVLDFDNCIGEIKLSFINNIADDLILPIEYVGADVKKYHEKEEKLKRERLLKDMSLKVNTGNNLVNIYWKLVDQAIKKVTIELYVGKEENKQLMAKYNIGNDIFYKAISELAYGEYGFVLKQIYPNGKIEVETDYITFKIRNENYRIPPVVLGK